MKKISKQNAVILMSLGLLLIATSQIFSRFIELSDFAKGSFIGIGIGLLLSAFIFGNFKTAQ